MNQILNTVQPVNCPDIAEPQEILTSDNLDHLAADNYNVIPGTIVNVRCLSNESHKLIGVKFLTCLDSGQWNHPLPKCVPRSWNDNIQFTNPMTNATMSMQELDFGRFPLIVGLSLLCLSGVSIAILLVYLIYTKRKRETRRKKAKNRSQFVHYNCQTASTAETLTSRSDQSYSFRAFDTEASYHVPSMLYHVPSYSGNMSGSLRFAFRRDQ